MKIIITGATGFIGRRVVSELAKIYKKDQLLFLVRDKDSKLEGEGRRIIKSYGFETKRVDLEKGTSLRNLPKNPEAIIHMAANTDTADPNHKTNDVGTELLLKAFGKLDSTTHFIHMSTTAIVSGRKNCSKPFNESSLPHPTNEYGRTKLRAEEILIKKSSNENFKLTILRLPTVYGKGMRSDSFFDFLKKLINKNSLIARINWPGLSSFIHVDDVAKVTVSIINHPPEPGKKQIFILQSESYNLQQVFEMTHKRLNKTYKPFNLPIFCWTIASFVRKYIQIIEPLLPSGIYNYFWRVSIIVDNVIYTKSEKIQSKIPGWKPKKLQDTLSEVL